MRVLLGVAKLWRGTLAHAPWPLQRAQVRMHYSSMLEEVTGLAPHTLSLTLTRTRCACTTAAC